MTTEKKEPVEVDKGKIIAALNGLQKKTASTHDATILAAEADKKTSEAIARLQTKKENALEVLRQAGSDLMVAIDDKFGTFTALCVDGRETPNAAAVKALNAATTKIERGLSNGFPRGGGNRISLTVNPGGFIKAVENQILTPMLLDSAEAELGGGIDTWKEICQNDIKKAIESKKEAPGDNAVSRLEKRIEKAGTQINYAAKKTFDTFGGEYFTWDPKDPNFAQLTHLLEVKRTIRDLIVNGKEVEKEVISSKKQSETITVTQNIANRPTITVKNVTDALKKFEDDAAQTHAGLEHDRRVSKPDTAEKTWGETLANRGVGGLAAGVAAGGLIAGPFGAVAGGLGGGLIASGSNDFKSRIKRTVAGTALVMSAFGAAAMSGGDVDSNTGYEAEVQKRAQTIDPTAPLKIEDYIYQPDSP